MFGGHPSTVLGVRRRAVSILAMTSSKTGARTRTSRTIGITAGLIGWLFLVEITSGILQGYYVPLISDIVKHLGIHDADYNWFEAAQLLLSALVVPGAREARRHVRPQAHPARRHGAHGAGVAGRSRSPANFIELPHRLRPAGLLRRSGCRSRSPSSSTAGAAPAPPRPGPAVRPVCSSSHSRSARSSARSAAGRLFDGVRPERAAHPDGPGRSPSRSSSSRSGSACRNRSRCRASAASTSSASRMLTLSLLLITSGLTFLRINGPGPGLGLGAHRRRRRASSCRSCATSCGRTTRRSTSACSGSRTCGRCS